MASAVEKVSLETARTPAPRCLLSVAVVVPYRVSFIPPVGTSTWIHHILSNRLHARLPSPPLPQSPNDERTYRAITLDNGLKIVVVHDATSDTAAAAVNVRAPAALFHEKCVWCRRATRRAATCASVAHVFPHPPCQPLTHRSKSVTSPIRTTYPGSRTFVSTVSAIVEAQHTVSLSLRFSGGPQSY